MGLLLLCGVREVEIRQLTKTYEESFHPHFCIAISSYDITF